MTDKELKLIDLIKHGKTLNEISRELYLSDYNDIYDLFKNLRLKGFELEKVYYYTGDIKYKLVYDNSQTLENKASLITKNSDQTLTFMLISDIHFGSIYDEVKYLDLMYEYCISNNIHIIINAGDLIDGLTFGKEKRLNSFEKQIDLLLQKYPFDKNIINFVCLGNHDLDLLQTTGQDLKTILNNERHDLVTLGYGMGFINVKNEKIYVKHIIKDYKVDRIPNQNLILSGHSHKSYVIFDDNCLIHIPTLSNMQTDNCFSYPGAIVMHLDFDRGYFNNGIFEQFIIVNDKLVCSNIVKCNLLTNRNINKNGIIYYEENKDGEYITPDTKKQKKKTK